MQLYVRIIFNSLQVIPSNVNIKLQDGFYFFYQILGNDVSSEPFHDAINPNFAAERASVRILSNTSVLKLFFQKNPSLKVELKHTTSCPATHFLAISFVMGLYLALKIFY